MQQRRKVRHMLQQRRWREPANGTQARVKQTFLLLLTLIAVSLGGSMPALAQVAEDSPPPSRFAHFTPVKGSKVRPNKVDQLKYRGGPIMASHTIYAIYWVPEGYSVSDNYVSIINQYLQDVGADSGTTGNVYYAATQYDDRSHTHVQYAVTFGGYVIDSSPFPPASCSNSVTPDYCLWDTQIDAEVSRVAAEQGWAPGLSNQYLMLTPHNVGVCRQGSVDDCTGTTFCAYHAHLATAGDELVYSYIVDPGYEGEPLAPRCAAQAVSPNGDMAADGAISLVSHEQIEAMTDPHLDAWLDKTGQEIADKCAWTFGNYQPAANGGYYNQVINGHQYLLQLEWSNLSHGCVQSGY